MADQPSHVHHYRHVRYSHVGSSSRPGSRPPPPQELIQSCPYGHGGSSAGPPMGTGGEVTPRRSSYRGIRQRSGKWVSEIREPGKASRIWLGTYATAEMAAVAYDVAAHALRGADAVLNFPNEIATRPVPASGSPTAIRSAAAEAAAALMLRGTGIAAADDDAVPQRPSEGQYIDEDEIFDMPQLLVNMAEGMLMSPPRLSPSGPDDLPEAYEGESLWSLAGQTNRGCRYINPTRKDSNHRRTEESGDRRWWSSPARRVPFDSRATAWRARVTRRCILWRINWLLFEQDIGEKHAPEPMRDQNTPSCEAAGASAAACDPFFVEDGLNFGMQGYLDMAEGLLIDPPPPPPTNDDDDESDGDGDVSLWSYSI
ncbi:hypothetical protein MUK42_17807 [Musa troglodytarum]|uniref:AP2/ERF domain-containing protein n=1 Tax=Musa troglodytarum TaxID=320322 RepID=A0A9E7EXK7_9LILI|nr:hypothetical protein MUK42_17807 [Musa troglodytarum]